MSLDFTCIARYITNASTIAQTTTPPFSNAVIIFSCHASGSQWVISANPINANTYLYDTNIAGNNDTSNFVTNWLTMMPTAVKSCARKKIHRKVTKWNVSTTATKRRNPCG